MFLDFYIPSKNIAIECQGIQHFRPIEKFGGEKEFEKVVSKAKQENKSVIDGYTIFKLYSNK